MHRFARSARHSSVVLDLSKDDPPTLRAKALSALSDTVSPHFYVAGFGFRESMRGALGVAKSAFAKEEVESGGAGSNRNTNDAEQRRHFDLNDPLVADSVADPAPELAEFKTNMHALATRLADILFCTEGGGADEDIEVAACAATEGVEIDVNSPLSIKWYRGKASVSETRLGAHIDGNMFTLLWSNTPGLQVLRPDADVDREDLMYFGMPLIGTGPVLSVSDEDFVDVAPPEGYELEELMLFTVGRSWFSESNPLTHGEQLLGAKCPVLHRVAFADQLQDRLSIPFLINFSSVVQ